jgi:hypothetical protein
MTVCSRCRRRNQQGNVFCAFCGSPLQPEAGASSGLRTAEHSRSALSPGADTAEPSLPVQLAAVVAVCALFSLIFGRVLGLPAQAIKAILPVGTCTNEVPGTFGMYICSMKVGLVTVAGPILVMVIIFLLRKPLSASIPRVNRRLPAQWHFVLPPLIATMAFTMSWAGYHVQTWNTMGIVPHNVFPAAIGLFTYGMARFGPEFGRALESVFQSRDRAPRFLRYVLVVAIPLGVSLVITYQERVSDEAVKEQFVVLVGLAMAYLLLAPRPQPVPVRAGVDARHGGVEGRLACWLLHGVAVGAVARVALGLLSPELALAHDCSSEADCQQTSGYNAATSVGGGTIGAGAGLLGVQIASGGGLAGDIAAKTSTSPTGGGPTVVDLDGKPLPLWSPDSSPGENGQAGKPGDILVEGNWEDPDYAEERMRQLREREKERNTFWDDVQDKSQQWLQNRHQQLEAEASAERKVRQDATDTVERIKQIARRHGYDDILERADGVAVNPDGSINIDYVNRLKYTLTRRIGRDVAAPAGKPTTADWVSDGLSMTAKEVFTGTDADGNTSYKSMLLRGLVGAATAGGSEYVYTPTDALYRMKDGVDRGESGVTLFGKAVGGAIVDELIGRAVGGALNKGITYVAKKFPGLTKTVSEYADDIYKRLNKPIGGAKPSALSSQLAAKKAALEAALDSGDDDAVRALYKNGGMDDLARLESGGHIAPDQAQKLNRVLTRTTDEAVDSATKRTVTQFKDETGVKVDELLVGDSGSSSRSLGPRSVRTDADRTLVSKFNQTDLQNYANRNNVSVDQAYDDLSRKFTGMQQSNIDEALPKGLSAADVDCKCYDRIGAGAGQSDCYPEGFTNARQAQGRTTVYQADADGNLARSYQTSGQATVDQNQLMKAQFGGEMSPDPTIIGSDELPKLLESQKASVASHSDAKSVAKAVTRADYVAGRAGQPLDPDVVDIASRIAGNPQGQQSILQSHGYTEEGFVNRARSMLLGYKPQL